jgi:heptosyltransferase-1
MQNCLVIKTSALGDIFQTLPCILMLRQSHPGLKITWVVEKKCLGALEGLLEIDQILVVDFKTWRKHPLKSCGDMLAFKKTLQSVSYDLVLDFQANSKSALILALAKAKQKRSFSKKQVAEWAHRLVKAQRIVSDQNSSTKFYQGLIQDLITCDSWKLPHIQEQKTLVLPEHDKLVMLGLGSMWPSKRLAMQQIKDVMKSMAQSASCYFLIPASSSERQDYQSLLEGYRGEVLSHSSILEYASYMKHVDCFIGVDSALLHLARLFKVPSVGVFGPSSSQFYGQIGDIQGSCPYGKSFLKRCDKLRSCDAPCMRLIQLQNAKLFKTTEFFQNQDVF